MHFRSHNRADDHGGSNEGVLRPRPSSSHGNDLHHNSGIGHKLHGNNEYAASPATARGRCNSGSRKSSREKHDHTLTLNTS